jgi:hypothetical protein
LLFLFAITLFVSAALLFCVQPMIAKMILPILGGTPGVWNTCIVFFQTVLLGGYIWSHFVSVWLGARLQVILHVVLLSVPLLLLPFDFPQEAMRSVPRQENPIPWLIVLLATTVGLPFFVLSTTAPLLQKWFAATGHSAGKDPYFLYGASNLGSMLALLSYPFLIEPALTLVQQRAFWALGYGLLAVLILACAGMLWRRPGIRKQESGGRNEQGGVVVRLRSREALSSDSTASPPQQLTTSLPDHLTTPLTPDSLLLTPDPTIGRRLRWLALAFVPSSLMLGVTTYLTTDIAPIPLLWVIPLALYLLTFILVFARKKILSPALMLRVLPLLALVMTVLLFAEDMRPPIWLLIPLHLLTFFVAAMACHGQLAQDRPATAHLTEFYLWLALGGVLGGLFNAIIAPLVFWGVAEYPLALVLACLLRPANRHSNEGGGFGWLDLALPLGVGGLTSAIVLSLQGFGMKPGQLSVGLMAGIPAAICYTLVDRPIRFALGIGAVLLAGGFYTGSQGKTIHVERDFFGVVRVTRDRQGKFIQLVHGKTIHGRQNPDQPTEPLAYFHPSGPVGRIFDHFNPLYPDGRVGVVGLGAGSMAAYARPEQKWKFYEIDPAVDRIANDYFTFLKDCQAGKPEVVLGDARLRLQDEPDDYFDLLFLDAFSSDAVPVHLLTKEALQLYVAKLKRSGFLCFNVSNRYVSLQPVLANLAEDADLTCIFRDDLSSTPSEKELGKEPSQWILMAHKDTDLSAFTKRGLWETLSGKPGARVWTDDYSNILEVFKWEFGGERD